MRWWHSQTMSKSFSFKYLLISKQYYRSTFSPEKINFREVFRGVAPKTV